MFLLQTIFKCALILCAIIGLAFMMTSTFLVIVSIMRGDISINVVVGKTDKEK